jgi:hypothetical protein
MSNSTVKDESPDIMGENTVVEMRKPQSLLSSVTLLSRPFFLQQLSEGLASGVVTSMVAHCTY